MNWILSIFFTLTAAVCSAGDVTDWYEPTRDNRPFVRWWWLGSAVDEQGLTYNLEQFAKAGLGGVEITPIYGLQNNEANDVEYLSPRWMELYKHTVAEAARLDLQVDMSNCTGWPFGGPQITLDHSASKYIIEKWPLSAGQSLSQRIATKDSRQSEIAVLERVMAVCGARRVDVTEFVSQDNMLRWVAPKEEGFSEYTIYALFSGRTLQRVKRAAPGGQGLVMNHYNANALKDYLSRFDKAFAGSRAPYPTNLFNDSFEVYGASWDGELLSQFERRHGYKLEDYLPEFLGEGDADSCARIVTDYRETLFEMLLENFTTPWTQWAHSHGALTRNQAHGSPGNIIDIYAAVDIPECESFGRTRFDIPGLRHDSIIKLNDGTPSVLKFASSATHLMGKRLTSAEGLTWLTEHFRTSLSQCKPEIDQMFAAGVNHIYFHGAPYSPKGVDFPGWLFYAAINMSPTNSIWHDAHAMFDYVTRCQSFLAQGQPDSDVLVYLPQYDIWHEQQKQPFLIFDIHKMDETMPAVKQAMDRIIECGYDGDYLSDRYLSTLSVDVNGELISQGGTHYRALLVPSCRKIPVESLRKIVQLTRQGATVIFAGNYPQDVPGFADLNGRREIFNSLRRQLPAVDNFSSTQKHTLSRGGVVTGEDYGQMLAASGITAEPFKSEFGGAMIRRKNEVGGYNYFISMLQNRRVDGWVSLATKAASVMIFDPMTGERAQAQIRPNAFGTIDVRIQLEAGQSLLLKTFASKIDVTPWNYILKQGDPKLIDRGWSISFPRSEPAIDRTFQTDSLIQWCAIDDPHTSINSATARYSVRFSIPDTLDADEWMLDLGDVRESALVHINGQEVSTLWAIPFRVLVGKWLQQGENLIEIDVTNLPSNRIADYERRGVKWRIFKDANVASVTNAKSFDFGEWRCDPSGLNSEVKLIPIYY